MLNKQKSIVTICCLLVILTTVSVYFLLFANLFDVKIQWVSLLWLLLAETMFTTKILITKKQTVITGAHLTSSIIHLIASFTLAVLFIVINVETVKWYILINVLLLSGIIIFDLLISYSQNHLSENSCPQLNAQKTFYECLSQMRRLSLQNKDTTFYTDMCTIEELLKYSDNTVITGDELKIKELIDELSKLITNEEIHSTAVFEIIENIKEVIHNRTEQLRYAKRGKH